ncbi:MAG TPA: hypothetical protein VFZ09_37430 [Archangium sp.]|uniref:hypothetical protein n=1 Tax=Archangium sp. TaxID=1872627 RepID=UPI002E2F913E|nr:hypothetical protein [Archangium sp.]HEX5751964.1 hypothetical protein [Archangium sp.]
MDLLRRVLHRESLAHKALKLSLPLALVVACGGTEQPSAEQAAPSDASSVEQSLGTWYGASLASATSSFSQSGWPVGHTVDGNLGSGYALYNPATPADYTQHQEISYRIANPLAQTRAGDFTTFRIDLVQNYGGAHQLGRFRIQFTRSPHASFAAGGDSRGLSGVRGSATWENFVTCFFDPTTMNGVTLAYIQDSFMVAQGTPPATTTYRLWCHAPTAGATGNAITGLKIDMAADPVFPTSGPGRAGNGNLVLNEVQVIQQLAPRGSIANSTYGQCLWVDTNNLNKVFAVSCASVGGTINADWIRVQVNSDAYLLRSGVNPNNCLDAWEYRQIYTGLRTTACNLNSYQIWHNPSGFLRNYGDMCAAPSITNEMFQSPCPWGTYGSLESYKYFWTL